MKRLTRLAVALASMRIGIDLASGPDETAYWEAWQKPKPKKATKDRTKIKAARKQRNMK